MKHILVAWLYQKLNQNISKINNTEVGRKFLQHVKLLVEYVLDEIYTFEEFSCPFVCELGHIYDVSANAAFSLED